MTLNASQLEQIRYAMEAVHEGAVLPPEMDRLVTDLVAEVERLRAENARLKAAAQRVLDTDDETDQQLAKLERYEAIVRAVAIQPRNGGPYMPVYITPEMYRRARALLAISSQPAKGE